MFDPDAGMPRLNRSLVYLGACIIAGLRLAREKQVNVRVVPTGKAIEESVGCRVTQPHTDDPLIKALVLRYTGPDKLLGWV